MTINPILLEVFKNRFSSICEEMGMVLTRTAFSSNIKERRDLSCAVFSPQAEMIAQAAHIPVHLGSMPLSVQAAVQDTELDVIQQGDVVMLNDPFQGGTHLPDITLVAPVFAGGDRPLFFVANRAHHSDIGGMSPGSMPLSTSLYQEGVIIPPVKIMRRGRMEKHILRLLLKNVRTPGEREGDLSAQVMANFTGIARLEEIIDRYGPELVHNYGQALIDYSERMMQKTIASIPDGTYRFEDFLDDDGQGAAGIPLRLELSVQGSTAGLDFTASADQVKGSVNAVRAITMSCVLYVLRCLVNEDILANSGCLRPVKVHTRPGSVLDALHPGAVAGGNVETSQRIVDVILGALSRAIPERIPAASQGTMNNVTIGVVDPRSGRAFTYYETLAGGMGASCRHHGESGVHSHMTNTLNTPVEALEHTYPFRVLAYGLRTGSGGRGRFCGGQGIYRHMQVLVPCEVTVLSDRRRTGPYGLKDGRQGMPGENRVRLDGQWHSRPGKFREVLSTGDELIISTPGGGGYGAAED
ncbi:hydantoinase B/oxoprolinase family protein [Desulfonatronospira sp. MSAO_Bac3]|uniref:hydantoinase B/oxoprolinase family protein n=1 Tax=Desulfonatronospira sp. MSAO_Bac3 TaxID=2293857 RepID=UPI000FF0C5AB|nr:hydantoinase B/oxoprolinase family protein [Desulfonatronospira sp. MSAO_Bac3]RQD75779.1 MAG: hydantoinase B/oxoprolinase family protein [Desulfonatronospira sp. MSAO_Bac3]